jgi:hypothetical protein
VFEEQPASALSAHPFDQAIALTPHGADTFSGHTSPAYWNMVGPFGGISAAVVLNAVMQHASRLGEPVSLTINYASAMVPGVFTVSARAARTNRSTQHWIVEVFQTSQAGAQETVLTACAITAIRRDTWGVNDMPMPPVPAPQDVARQTVDVPLEWLKRYELRMVNGKMPSTFDGLENGGALETASLTQVWLRDEPPRAPDFCALAAFADVFYPRVYLRRPSPVPVGTVSMTVYFHASRADLAACGHGYVLGQARGQVFRDGFFDQSAQLWSESGTLLVTSLQIVYFKE